MQKKEHMTYEQFKLMVGDQNRKQPRTDNLVQARADKRINDESKQANTNIVSVQQVMNARERSKNAQERLKRTQHSYELFLNQQTNTDQYDFLETGGASEQLQMEKLIHMQNLADAQNYADQAKNTYNDLLETYTEQLRNTEKIRYETMEMEDLDALKENQKTVVDQNQAEAMKAQNDYGVYINQWSNTDNLDFLEGNWGITEDEKKKQQDLLQGAYTATKQLSDSRESLHLMEDTYNYRYNTQLLSKMPETDKIVLQLYANKYNVIGVVNTLTSEQRELLRATGKYGQIIKDPEAYLKQRGYEGEDLALLAETHTRQQNAERMETVQQTAETIGEKAPIIRTLSTYPTAFIGKATSGITALDSFLRRSFGQSKYHGIDVNRPGYIPMVYADTVRDTVSDMLGTSGGLAYDSFNEGVDNKIAKVLLGPKGARLLNIAGTFGRTARNTALTGGTTNEAFGLGMASAGLDWLTSKISVEELLKTKSLEDWNQFAKTSLSGAVGITQESLDYIGNLVIQTAILAEDRDFYRQVDALVQTGMSEEEAKKQVYTQYLCELEYAIAWSFAKDGFEIG